MVMVVVFLISGMTIPEEDADVGQGSKYCLVAIGRLQVRPIPIFIFYSIFHYDASMFEICQQWKERAAF